MRITTCVASVRGAHGGYQLARMAGAISGREIVTAAEHATCDLHCVSHPVDEARCAETRSYSIRPVWILLQTKIDEVLEGVKLADLLPEEREVRARVGLTVLSA